MVRVGSGSFFVAEALLVMGVVGFVSTMAGCVADELAGTVFPFVFS